MKQMIRNGGMAPSGYVPSNITSDRVETEEHLLVAENRDQAIDKFRRDTGFRGRISRCYEISSDKASYRKRAVQRQGGRFSISSELEEELAAALKNSRE